MTQLEYLDLTATIDALNKVIESKSLTKEEIQTIYILNSMLLDALQQLGATEH